VQEQHRRLRIFPETRAWQRRKLNTNTAEQKLSKKLSRELIGKLILISFIQMIEKPRGKGAWQKSSEMTQAVTSTRKSLSDLCGYISQVRKFIKAFTWAFLKLYCLIAIFFII